MIPTDKNVQKPADKIVGYALFVFITIAAAILGRFHEPWFDEAQAFLIARDASLRDILFVLPHYEGHPPLWHLILLAPAKLGLSCRDSLYIAQLATFVPMLFVLETRSPFCWKLKLFFSASYFILYQYSAISRPYALLALAGMSVAATYTQREEKPFRYLASAVFLCLCHSYGVAIAGGIAAADVSRRFLSEKSAAKAFAKTSKKLVAAYCILLGAALAIFAEVFPKGNAGGLEKLTLSGGLKAFVFSYTLLPSDAFFTSIVNDDEGLQTTAVGAPEFVVSLLFSAAVWFVMLRILRKRKLVAEFVLPYVFLSLFMAVYSSPHHFGVFIVLCVMSLWTAQKAEPLSLSELGAPLKKSKALEKYADRLVCGVFCVSAAVNVFWSANCWVTDFKRPYDASEKAARWIKDNGLEDKLLISAWNENSTRVLTYGANNLNAYADKTLFANADGGYSYCTHYVTSDEEYAEDIEKLKALGSPDAIFSSSVMIKDELEELGLTDKYVLCYLGKGERCFKDKIITVYSVVYVREDLADGVEKSID